MVEEVATRESSVTKHCTHRMQQVCPHQQMLHTRNRSQALSRSREESWQAPLVRMVAEAVAQLAASQADAETQAADVPAAAAVAVVDAMAVTLVTLAAQTEVVAQEAAATDCSESMPRTLHTLPAVEAPTDRTTHTPMEVCCSRLVAQVATQAAEVQDQVDQSAEEAQTHCQGECPHQTPPAPPAAPLQHQLQQTQTRSPHQPRLHTQ